jgi:DNA polymerase III epsilon subunit-like protein
MNGSGVASVFPKLCTVAGMRRRYPGHKSYSLGKLCELYGIELVTHHRALCDARATGHLLNLMNLKREGCETERGRSARRLDVIRRISDARREATGTGSRLRGRESGRWPSCDATLRLRG